jgi:hypothetical protein
MVRRPADPVAVGSPHSRWEDRPQRRRYQRRRDHKNDEQNQHDVNERRRVDLVDNVERIFAVVETMLMTVTPPSALLQGAAADRTRQFV